MSRRNTAAQTAVLALLRGAGGALSHDDIQQRIGVEVNRATIYRILNRFTEDGRCHRIVADDGRQYFALCAADCDSDQPHSHNHLHFRCLSCERVECLPEPLHYRLPAGYRAAEVQATVAGYCALCAKAKGPPQAEGPVDKGS